MNLKRTFKHYARWPRQQTFRRTWWVAAILLGFTLGVFHVTREQPTEGRVLSRRSVPRGTGRPKSVLVTGVAGFIGYHVARALVSSPDTAVVGIDNFNDYYDVRLKQDRAYELSLLGVEVLAEDLCTGPLLETLLVSRNLTHVVHLAAQAGVRYSLDNPLTYVRSNVECQLVLLDALSRHPSVKLVYASSSSVYGKTSAVPFRLSEATDRPSNMYAATKKADELLAAFYCRSEQLSAVGLRFFTVYGPWGRPDMAVYKFAEAILNNKELPLFQKSVDAPLERDFTYVDDVVSGILAALDYDPAECGERFNLGFGHPLSVPHLVQHLEDQLGVKANVKMLPIPPSEILKTWADISTSREFLGFNPTVNLTEGVRRFAAWYKGYRQQRSDEDRTGRPSPGQIYYKKLEEDRIRRHKIYEREEVEQQNERLRKRLKHDKEKYQRWAQHHGQEVPELNKDSFLFYQGLDSPGGDIIHAPGLRGNIEALRVRCGEVEQCVAFTSHGVLKDRLRPRDRWAPDAKFTGSTQGLYVADLDVCKADLHDCSKDAECLAIMPAQYECRCNPKFTGNGHTCLPLYGTLTGHQMEREFFVEYFSDLNVTKIKQAKHMHFFQGYDSPGGDYMVSEEFANDPLRLQEICQRDPICLGVNTNGVMKKRVLPSDKWVKWTDDPARGIYVYDVNYCLLSDTACPPRSECGRVGVGSYRCRCQDGYVMDREVCVTVTPGVDARKTHNRNFVGVLRQRMSKRTPRLKGMGVR